MKRFAVISGAVADAPYVRFAKPHWVGNMVNKVVLSLNFNDIPSVVIQLDIVYS
jgi:hypothetical protein